jgi:hypothetical protein
MDPRGFEPRNPNMRAAAGFRFRPDSAYNNIPDHEFHEQASDYSSNFIIISILTSFDYEITIETCSYTKISDCIILLWQDELYIDLS